MASSPHRSVPERVPLVPPHRAAERGTLASSTGTEQRNGSGTTDLKLLAEQALFRIRNGTQQRNAGGTEPSKAFRTPGTLPPDGCCKHIPEKNRFHPANDGRTVLCAECFLARHPDWRPRAVEPAPRPAPLRPAPLPSHRGNAPRIGDGP
jgi:hypothetical protein